MSPRIAAPLALLLVTGCLVPPTGAPTLRDLRYTVFCDRTVITARYDARYDRTFPEQWTFEVWRGGGPDFIRINGPGMHGQPLSDTDSLIVEAPNQGLDGIVLGRAKLTMDGGRMAISFGPSVLGSGTGPFGPSNLIAAYLATIERSTPPREDSLYAVRYFGACPPSAADDEPVARR